MTAPAKKRGRPEVAPEARLVQRSIRLTDAQWAKLDALGLNWLRKLLQRTRASGN